MLSKKMQLYIYNLVPPMKNSLRHSNTFNMFSCRTDYFKISFLLSVVTEWSEFEAKIQNSSSEDIFHNFLLEFIRLVASKTYSINDPIGLKLLAKLLVGFS